MTPQERKRMIELLIKEVDATGKATGVWYSPKKDALELQKLLIIFEPDNESRRESLKRFVAKNPNLN